MHRRRTADPDHQRHYRLQVPGPRLHLRLPRQPQVPRRQVAVLRRRRHGPGQRSQGGVRLRQPRPPDHGYPHPPRRRGRHQGVAEPGLRCAGQPDQPHQRRDGPGVRRGYLRVPHHPGRLHAGRPARAEQGRRHHVVLRRQRQPDEGDQQRHRLPHDYLDRLRPAREDRAPRRADWDRAEHRVPLRARPQPHQAHRPRDRGAGDRADLQVLLRRRRDRSAMPPCMPGSSYKVRRMAVGADLNGATCYFWPNAWLDSVTRSRWQTAGR